MNDHLDQEFDRLFARDLKMAGQNARPNAEEWHAISTRLDAVRYRRRMFIPWLILPLLLLSNGWMLLQWQQLRKQMLTHQQSAEVPVSVVPQQPHASVIVYDTVYRTVIITHKIVQPIQDAAISSISSKNIQTVDSESVNTIILNQNNKTTNPTAGITGTHSTATGKHTATIPETGLPLTANTGIVESTYQVAVQDSARNKQQVIEQSAVTPTTDSIRRQSAIAAFDSLLSQPAVTPAVAKKQRPPLHWTIGARMGSFNLGDAEHIDLDKPFAAAITGEIGIGEHWAIVPGLLYQSCEYRTGHYFDKRLLIDHPVAPDPEYKLGYTEGRFTRLTPSVLVQYQFRPAKKLSWNIGAGYAAQFTFFGETENEFFKMSTGEGYHYDAHPENTSRLLIAATQVGVTYAIRPHWSVFGSLNGLVDAGDGQKSFSMLVGQLGLQWKIR